MKNNSAKPDSLIATAAKMQPFIQALAAETAQECVAAPLAVAEVAQNKFEQTWTLIHSLQPAAFACGAGCCHCCHLTAETTGAEALWIARYLERTRTPEQMAELKIRVAGTAAQVKGLSPEARAAAKVPCSLLENGQCAAYAARPLGCRAWNIRSVEACEAVLRNGAGDLRRFQDQRPPGIHDGVAAGLTRALTAAGLPEPSDQPCELNAGLRIALLEPDAATRWQAGEDVFAPARIMS